jgi:hypothetical protein
VQADQIRTVILTTPDEHFHRLLSDPRNPTGNLIPHVYHESHTAGVGLMFRVLDLPLLIAALGGHDFGGQSLTLAIDVRDSFLPENAGTTTVRFTDGRAQFAPDTPPEATIRLDVADLSALVVGAAPFRRLHTYGLAVISDERFVETVDRLFRVSEPPMNVSRF